MKAKDVKLGETYAVKVSGKIQPVKLTREANDFADRNGSRHSGGWHGINQNTGRDIRIRSAAKLRYPWV